MKKIIIRVVIVLVILLIVAVVGVGFFLDGIVKKGVETVGPELAKVSVKLDGVHLSLLSGACSVKGLEVGNPEGYKSPQSIGVGYAKVAVSPGSLLSDKIVVKSVQVDAPEITLEGGLKENNLTKILDNVDATTGGGTTTNKPAATETAPGKKIEVDDLLITNVKVNVSLTTLGGKSFSVTVPQIHLTDLGKNSDGITAGELTKRVLHEVIDSVTSAVASNATNLGKEAGESAGKAAEKLEKGIGNLFKKK